jgi:hypothetical protein
MLMAVAFVTAQTSNQVARAAENPNAPVITFENTVHDYGTIEQGSDGTCYFEFENTGKEPLILQKPRSSCGCTVPTWPKTPILPGETDKIKVTYNTKRMGKINKTVTVLSNATNSSVILRITGKVVAKVPEQMPEKEAGAGAPINK